MTERHTHPFVPHEQAGFVVMMSHDRQAEAAAMARMQAEIAAQLQAVETHQAELLAAQAAQDAAREAAAMEAMHQAQAELLKAMESHTGELHAMYQAPPPGSPLPRFSWPNIPANTGELTKAQARDWLAQNAYPDTWTEAAKHQLGDFTGAQLRSMMTGEMPAPRIIQAPATVDVAAPVAPIPVPVNVPPLAGVADGTAMDQFMVMTKDQVLDWIIANWYNGNELIRPIIAGNSLEDLLAMIAERSGV